MEARRRLHPPPGAELSRPQPRWVMLDRFVHYKAYAGEAVAEEVMDGTQSAISSTCTNISIAVSLRVAEPPAVSRLYLHWPERFMTASLSQVSQPFIIAAHGRSILFQAYAPFVGDSCPAFYYYPIDYFLYTASGSEKSPCLMRLPPCFDGGDKNPDVDLYFHPYRLQQLRSMWRDDIGLLCRGKGEFVVAQLTFGGQLCVLHRKPGEEEGDMNWSVENMPLPDGDDIPNLLCGSWQTDAVVPYGGCYLCWADCYLGLLFVGVIDKRTKPPCYVPLPDGLDSNRLCIDPGYPDPARRVCVSESGLINLICVGDRAGCSVCASSYSAFTITVWTFTNLREKKWMKCFTMEDIKFWAALDFDKRLPHVLPEFPTISLVKPDVVSFRLNGGNKLFWLIEIDMKKEVLGSTSLYIFEEEEEKCSTDMAHWRSFPGYSFVPSPFTRYLDQHAIRSEKLQNIRLEQAKEKIFVEE
ncbi:uncharacterized protein [Aegilops tauschii subsp. strangulata]|uniref:uncharacterized protein isoform X1 n=1 Tax=Aegilops tauschii subsp. strangulata TaxID=200361 RepID=UPI003CC8B690